MNDFSSAMHTWYIATCACRHVATSQVSEYSASTMLAPECTQLHEKRWTSSQLGRPAPAYALSQTFGVAH